VYSSGLPSTKELPDALACHRLALHITPPSWKSVLTNMPIEELCDLHDKSYTRQAVLDNHLNSCTREVVRTLASAREKMDEILARERKKDQEIVEVQAKCEEALRDLEQNPLVQDLRSDIANLEKDLNKVKTECKKLRKEEAKVVGYKEEIAKLEIKCGSLEEERSKLGEREIKLCEDLDGLKRKYNALKKDRAAVVSKVIPYIAMELYHSDEVGKMIGDVVNVAIYHGKCTTLEEVSTTGKSVELSEVAYYRAIHKAEYDHASNLLTAAEYPFLVDATKDPMASFETLLSKKPRRVKPTSVTRKDTPVKPAPEKPSSPKLVTEKPQSPGKGSAVQPPSPKTDLAKASSLSKASPEASQVQQERPKSPGK
jgi:predicted RNase H-like nuclease (RuvC/YqgF family)